MALRAAELELGAEHVATVVEALTYRYYGHNTGDEEAYREPAEVQLWRRTRDPIDRLVAAMRDAGELSEGEREKKFSGHSLRAGLASSAEVDERWVQKQLGHASAEMTRRYQRRRDRFRVNLTKAAGL